MLSALSCHPVYQSARSSRASHKGLAYIGMRVWIVPWSIEKNSAPSVPGRSLCGLRSSSEATTGFEPVMRVLQTLALPLGDVAAMERETGFEPATFSLARRCSTPEPLPHCCVPTLARRLPNYTAPPDSLSSRQQEVCQEICQEKFRRTAPRPPAALRGRY